MLGRRALLRGLLPAGAVALAGCGADEGPATPEPTVSASPTRRPGPVPAERVLGASATAADGTRVAAREWATFQEVAYETPDDSGTVAPERGRFLAYDFTIENTDDERLPAVLDTVFRLQLAGAEYRHVHDLRGAPFDAVRQPEADPGIRPLDWYEGLDPGASARLQLVFDVPYRPRFRHYLAWDHPTTVAGLEGPVFLWPGGE